MTDPISLIDLSAGPISRFLRSATREMRTVRKVRTVLRRAGYTIDSIQLRRVLYTRGIRDSLAVAPQPGDDISQLLASVISPKHSDGITLLRTTLTRELEHRLEGSTQTSQFGEVRAADRHQQVMGGFDQVMDGVDRIERALAGGGDDTVFEYRLTDMHPIRANEIREIHAQWPGTADIVAAIATTADLTALLRRWASYPPPALATGPPELLGVIADIAEDIPGGDSRQLAVPFIERALELGVDPRGYWLVRLCTLRGIQDIEEAAAALADVRGYPLAEASLHPNGPDEAIAVLEDWAAPTRREEILRRLLLTQYYESTGRIDDAVAIARDTATRYDSTSAALLAVRGLMARHLANQTTGGHNDLDAALLLAVDVRTKRRQWHLDSGAALAAEIKVRRLLNDPRGALDIANGVGEIPATPEELRNPVVIAEIALIQADRGDIEIAKRLLDEAPASRQPHIAAVIAEHEGRTEDAIRHWTDAIDATTEWGEKADLALQLAFQGIRSPFVDRLEDDYPDTAREITLTAALYAETPGALEEFRTHANSSHRGALFLYMYFTKRGDPAAAAAVAAAGGARWNDPDFWLESARYQLRQGNHQVAIDQTRTALNAASTNWGSRRVAYGVLLEGHSALGDWQNAQNAAAQLVADDDQDTAAAWALVICEQHLQDLPAALRAWQAAGGPEPTDETEVHAWIELLRAYGTEVGTARDALQIAARFPGNEPIHRGLLGAFFLGPQTGPDADDEDGDEGDDVAGGVGGGGDPGGNGGGGESGEGDDADPDRVAFQELLGEYVRTYPDGPIQQVRIDPDDLLGSLRDVIGERRETSGLDDALGNGTLPYGFAAEATGRTYLEALILRSDGPVLGMNPAPAVETATFEAAHRDGVVVDLSTLVTIARLPDALRTRLAGHFANARVLSEQHADATQGLQSLRRASGMSLRPGDAGESPTVERRAAVDVAADAAIGETVEQSFTQYVSTSHPALTAIDGLAGNDFRVPFLLTADQAIEAGIPLWVDDGTTVNLVRGLGGMAFDTPALLRHLRAEGDMEFELLDLAEATLVAHGYTGIPFDDTIGNLAATLGASRQGLMNAIRLSDAADINRRAGFVGAQIDAHVDDPLVLAGLVYSFAEWLIKVAPDPDAASDNLRHFARVLLRQRWMSSSTLPYCVNAFRATSAKPAVALMLAAIYLNFEHLASVTDDATAAQATFELISRLDPPDAYRVRAAVLAREFD